MSVQIVTGYTGERHITPYMDATVNRGIFGEDGCILSSGSQMSASMPDINTFVIADGAFSIQGHIGITNGETLTVDTCASGSRRIDLVVARFEHDSNTNIDTLSIVLLKGTETTSQYPTTPAYRTGTIADGANADLPLYQINLDGSTVTFSQMVHIHASDIWNYSSGTDLIAVEGNRHDTGFNATRTDTGVSAFFGVGAGGINHGVWSRTNNHWMIYEDNNGVTMLPSSDIRLGNHSSAIGTHINAYLTANKTCASERWYALCSVNLPAGTWLVVAGARWNGNASGNRQFNVSSVSADTSQNVSVAPATSSVTSSRMTTAITTTATKRYYLNVYQNSGSNIVCPASGAGWGNFLTAVRLV